MSTLRDEAYEKLDYLSQLTEVVLSPQNELLAILPDRLELSLDDIRKNADSSYAVNAGLELRPWSILRGYAVTEQQTKNLHNLTEYFEFQYSDDLEINFETNTMVGSVALVKKISQIDEKKLLTFAVGTAVKNFDRYSWYTKKIKERTVTILNTLDPNSGTLWAQQTNGKVRYEAKEAIIAKLEEVILENKWRVRDATVIEKMGKWINSYLTKEDDNTGLMNLIKLKIMLDKDLPVYSIDEVKNDEPA